MRKLISARKLWKFFTSTLQSKLHKLNRSKAIKKPPKSLLINKTCKKRLSWPNFSIQSPRKSKNYRFKPTQKLRLGYHQHHRYRHLVTKRHSPVYIDQLFLQPESAAQELQQPSNKKAMEREGCQEASSSSSANRNELIDQINEHENQETMHSEADDMWESMGLASPLTDGINERAEEFITRFRAEMQNQDNISRR